MGNSKLSILYLSYILLVIEFVAGLFIAPAVAQDTESEPKLGLKLELEETFDNPAAPGWALSDGTFMEDSILHLPPGGAQASHVGTWHNYTSIFILRRSGSGAVGITFTSGQDSIRLVLGDELIEARRLRSGLGVDMIVERPVPGPPEIPVGEWFTLRVTQLDTSIIVGVDGVRLYNLYDPSPDPLPPSGLALTAVGNATIEVDKVVVIPWVIENFDGPLSSAWELSDVDTTPFVSDGKLTVPQGEVAVRKGNWRNITFYARVRRDGLRIALLTYVGHVLEIHHNFIVFSSEIGGQSQKLAEAFLPELQGDPEFDMWMDVMVVVRDGLHHVFAYGVELLGIPDEVLVGPVSAEAFEGDFVLDRLMLGPPLPLWPAGSGSDSNEPGDGEPGGDGTGGEGPDGREPDAGGPNVLSADLAVTDLYPDHAPTGRLFFRITNNGPDALEGAPVTVTCGGMSVDVTTGAVTHIPDTSQGTFSITLAHGQTQTFPTSINLDLNNFEYDLHCTVSAALGSGVFTDPEPVNNTYVEEFDAVIPAAPTVDLAVTDLFPEQVPTGKLYLRISNYGPDSLQSVPVTVYCGGVATDLSSGTRTRIPVASQGTFNITIAPGQTNEFPTQIDLDLDQFAYDFSCEVRAATDVVTDPVPSNNTYSEHIELLQQVHIIQADLAVTDIFLQPEPADPSSKDIYCRITNKGPDALQNITVLLTTGVQYSGLAPTFFPGIPVTITLQPSDTGIFDTGIDFVETGMQLPFQVTCQISSPSLLLIDPDSSNNSYVEPYNRYAELSELQADLAVTDIFPDSLPNGNIFCRITNRGPDALQNAVVFLVTFRTDNPGPQETKAGYIDKWLTVTLQHNQTGEFDTGWDVTASLYPIEFSCAIVPYLTDPVTGNDSYSEIINTSP